jgi:hypothetical protein
MTYKKGKIAVYVRDMGVGIWVIRNGKILLSPYCPEALTCILFEGSWTKQKKIDREGVTAMAFTEDGKTLLGVDGAMCVAWICSLLRDPITIIFADGVLIFPMDLS